MINKEHLQAAVETLELYNARATALNESQFLAETRESPRTFALGGSPFCAQPIGGPSALASDAFLLMFRLFLSDGDGYSFGKIRALYRKLPIDSSIRAEVEAICAEVERYLAAVSPFDFFGERPSRETLLRAYLFGGRAHDSRRQIAQLKAWGIADDIRPLVEHEVDSICLSLLQAIFWIRGQNLLALNVLAKAN